MSELKRAIEKHKNCPCCDSENISVGSVFVSFGEDIFIKCNSCGIKLQICKEYGYRELLKRWNTRKPMDRIVERLELLKMAELDYSDEEPRYTDFESIYDAGMSDGKYKAYYKAIEIVKEEGEINE